MGDLTGYRNGRSNVAYQKPLSTDTIIVFLKLFIMGKYDKTNEERREFFLYLEYHTYILLPTLQSAY
jgi:hypothetical protein